MALIDQQPASPRIALIHALAHSVAPINAAFARQWPQARLMNLLDDSLSADLAANGRGLDATMQRRFDHLSNYALDTGAAAILFTCSAFGPCIDAVAAAQPGIPVLPPNRAMIDELTGADSHVGAHERIGLIATFAPTLASMPAEFPDPTRLELALADGALTALNAGDAQAHDDRIVEAALALRARGCSRIALAQFSMARARQRCVEATGLPVYSTVDSAVAALHQLLHQPMSDQQSAPRTVMPD